MSKINKEIQKVSIKGPIKDLIINKCNFFNVITLALTYKYSYKLAKTTLKIKSKNHDHKLRIIAIIVLKAKVFK